MLRTNRSAVSELCLFLVATLVLTHAEVAGAQCEPSGTLPPVLVGQRGCHLISLGMTPLSDLGCGTYQGVQGGLYPGGAEMPPDAHRVGGRMAAASVVPRDSSGQPAAGSGWIGLASIGMSNTSIEFTRFETLAQNAEGIHPRLVIVNGAQGGRPAEDWADPGSVAWSVLDQRLAAAGLSPAQLQVVWIKQANARPGNLGPFHAHAKALRDDLFAIVRIAKARYPNLAIAYLSSRTRAYTTVASALNPEPFAYESGFSVKRLIADQIAGAPALRFDGPDAPAPWLAWGPYVWADGEVPRADGFTWACTDTAADFTHPSHAGAEKIAEALLIFFQTEPTAWDWFVAPRRSCGLLGLEPILGLLVVPLARWRRRWRRSAC